MKFDVNIYKKISLFNGMQRDIIFITVLLILQANFLYEFVKSFVHSILIYFSINLDRMLIKFLNFQLFCIIFYNCLLKFRIKN